MIKFSAINRFVNNPLNLTVRGQKCENVEVQSARCIFLCLVSLRSSSGVCATEV